MKKLEINTMVLGQTGVGKSSLINYLYGKEVVRAGTGKPVTGRNDFTKITVPSPNKPDVKINIFDSWGLESDKAEDWEAVIDKKLISDLSFDEMIFAIVYCSSYSNDRVQDFEVKMLMKLLSCGYKVTIALTNADNSDFEKKKSKFREKYAKELPNYRGKYSVVDICAQAKPKLGENQPSVQIFGKEELFKELERDFYVNFINVVHKLWEKWKNESLGKIDSFYESMICEISEFENNDPLEDNKSKGHKIKKDIHDKMKTLTDDIQSKIKSELEDLKEWHEQAAGALYQGDSEFYLASEMSLPEYFEWVEKRNSFLDGIWDFYFGEEDKKELKIKLQMSLYKAIDKMKEKINEIYSKVEEMRRDLERWQRGKNS
jgi:GTPase SAR1 family protein